VVKYRFIVKGVSSSRAHFRPPTDKLQAGWERKTIEVLRERTTTALRLNAKWMKTFMLGVSAAAMA
jgi:hypothetical protein